MGPLSQAFLAAWKGAAPVEDVEPDLVELYARAHDAWPAFSVGAGEFCRYLGERAALHLPAAEAARRLRVEDLYLACGCTLAAPAALAAFDARVLSRVGAHLARMDAGAQLVDDTRQALRAKLLISTDGAPPKITQYAGLAPLDSWVRVAAIRTALNLAVSERAHAGHHQPLDSGLVAPGDNPELDYLRARYRVTFAAALKEAIAALPPHERALLRLHFVDGLTPEHIGGIYGVHRTTVMRRIQAAQEQVLEGTRARATAALDVSTSECDSLLELVRSRLPITLTSILRSA